MRSAPGSPRRIHRSTTRERVTASAAGNVYGWIDWNADGDFGGTGEDVVSGAATHPDADLKNAVVVSSGELDWDRPATWTGAIDRSPCGTGTCAKMASLHAKGLLPLDQDFKHEGILGTIFTGRLLRKTQIGPYTAVVPLLSGQAWVTGFAQYVVDPDDPFPNGFTVGDIWGGAMD